MPWLPSPRRRPRRRRAGCPPPPAASTACPVREPRHAPAGQWRHRRQTAPPGAPASPAIPRHALPPCTGERWQTRTWSLPPKCRAVWRGRGQIPLLEGDSDACGAAIAWPDRSIAQTPVQYLMLASLSPFVAPSRLRRSRLNAAVSIHPNFEPHRYETDYCNQPYQLNLLLLFSEIRPPSHFQECESAIGPDEFLFFRLSQRHAQHLLKVVHGGADRRLRQRGGLARRRGRACSGHGREQFQLPQRESQRCHG
ncbi:hypothetical protein CBM2606_A90163 [Cupriavidus taiwanensis]|nr:hypothetical protein CBM2606_A90163 [Cupriavidus taiwanensis]